jgi:hypothetical protein
MVKYSCYNTLLIAQKIRKQIMIFCTVEADFSSVLLIAQKIRKQIMIFRTVEADFSSA